MHIMPYRQKSFYVLFVVILVIHACMMAVELSDKLVKTSWITPPQKVIKLDMNQGAIKATVLAQAKRQIVQSEDTTSQEIPKDSAFLSDKDRSFNRQTVAKSVDIFKNAGIGDATRTQIAKDKMVVKDKPSENKPSIKDLKLSDIGLASNPYAKEIQEIEQEKLSKSIKGMKNGDANSQGLSATNDYVDEVALGDFTHLNTVEYKFYGFFHRIRQKLEQFWGKSIQEKAANIFKSGRRIPASENLITSLQVTLNEKGEIVGVKILGASGIKELDDAALESFNQAGPFPNPPKDLLVNGKAVIEWGFVVKG